MASPILETRSLSKMYGVVLGVNDLTLSLPAGVHGMLGPNGAGKSTFLKLITGELRPSEGEIIVMGERPWNNPALFRRIGYCPEYDGFWSSLSAEDFVIYLARMSGLSPADAKQRTHIALERVGATSFMRRRISTYSKGMRQRTKLGQALVHDPELIVLDEPLSGLDPVGRHEIMQIVRALAASGKSIILSSHVLHEVQAITEDFMLIYGGRVLASGNVHEIRSLMNNYPHRILLRCDRPRELAKEFARDDSIEAIEFCSEGGSIAVQTRDPRAFYEALPRRVVEAKVAVREVASQDDNLEAVFKYLVEG